MSLRKNIERRRPIHGPTRHLGCQARFAFQAKGLEINNAQRLASVLEVRIPHFEVALCSALKTKHSGKVKRSLQDPTKANDPALPDIVLHAIYCNVRKHKNGRG